MPYSEQFKRYISPLDDRISEAIRRVTNGHGQMRIPVDPSDSDIVLSDCRAEIARLRAFVKRVAYEPIGPADASAVAVLDIITKEALAFFEPAHETTPA